MKRFLILENGQIFEGLAFGADKEVAAEVVFTTSMVGFVGMLTDLSYTGQAVVQTFPMLGNYGYLSAEEISEGVGPAAYIVREVCDKPSNFRTETDIDAFLKKKGIVGICGIDTRALTRVLREQGVMNGVITDTLDDSKIALAKAHKIVKPVSAVSTKKTYEIKAENERFKVAVLDFGLRKAELQSLLNRGCSVTVFPFDTAAKEIEAISPDGIFLTNGPGNPKDNAEAVKNVKELLNAKIPTMGICLGHQIIALANGFDTEKLLYGHRGSNQPVRNLEDGKTYISAQNHGYAVKNESINHNIATVLFENVNDGTNEGLSYKNAPVFSVQFHPEAGAAKNDTSYLYDKFISLMEEKLCR